MCFLYIVIYITRNISRDNTRDTHVKLNVFTHETAHLATRVKNTSRDNTRDNQSDLLVSGSSGRSSEIVNVEPATPNGRISHDIPSKLSLSVSLSLFSKILFESLGDCIQVFGCISIWTVTVHCTFSHRYKRGVCLCFTCWTGLTVKFTVKLT